MDCVSLGITFSANVKIFLWSTPPNWASTLRYSSSRAYHKMYCFVRFAKINSFQFHRAVFKRLSKVLMWLLRLVIGLKESRQFFNQWEAKPKPIAPRTRNFSRASRELQVIARNFDWFIALFVPVVIGRSNCFGFGFSTVICKPPYKQCRKRCNRTRKEQKVYFFLRLRLFWSCMDCFNVITSGVAGMRKREDQSQNTSFQSYIFEKWGDCEKRQNLMTTYESLQTTKTKSWKIENFGSELQT